MLRVERYEARHRHVWDDFAGRSKNATFLLQRGYLEYHADRFVDASRLVFDEDKPVALLPASRHGDEARSHGGLTYGGVLSDRRMTTALMLEVFAALCADLRADGCLRLLYKPIPHIYHAMPAEEDLYALFRHGARLVRRDVAQTLWLAERPALTKGRKWAIKQGLGHGIRVGRSHDWGAFMAMEAALLQEKYGTQPVHSAAEIALLAERFPDNVQLFCAHLGDELLGGTIVFDTAVCAHAQYISSTAHGRDLRALDVLFAWLLDTVFATRRWFDFGISTEQQGQVLNEGLCANKESWGARAIAYDFYELDL